MWEKSHEKWTLNITKTFQNIKPYLSISDKFYQVHHVGRLSMLRFWVLLPYRYYFWYSKIKMISEAYLKLDMSVTPTGFDVYFNSIKNICVILSFSVLLNQTIRSWFSKMTKIYFQHTTAKSVNYQLTRDLSIFTQDSSSATKYLFIISWCEMNVIV